jgi:hypothetical protein
MMTQITYSVELMKAMKTTTSCFVRNFYHFGVIGKIALRTTLGQGRRYNEYCTESDETVYANNYDIWIEQANSDGKYVSKISQRFLNEANKGKGNTYNSEGRNYYMIIYKIRKTI